MGEKKTPETVKRGGLSGNAVVAGTEKYFKTNLGILGAFIGLFIFLSIVAENFFTFGNMINVLRTVTTNSFIAIGVMLAIILAGIDLNGGSMCALSGCFAVALMTFFHVNIWIAAAGGVFLGVAVGFAAGSIITYTGLHPFVVTLAIQSICRGAAYLIANGQPITTDDPTFNEIGNGYLGIIPLPVIYMVVFLFLTYLLLNRTATGRHIYAVGGNRVAARFSGINVHKIELLVYTISGTLGAFGGIVLASRMASGQPAVGVGYETDAIAAAVLGGTSMYGGTGTVGGMFIGCMVLGLINNGLDLMHVNSFWQYVVKGVIIIAAVYLDVYRKKKANIPVSSGFAS